MNPVAPVTRIMTGIIAEGGKVDRETGKHVGK
jgi:hypothetical protein